MLIDSHCHLDFPELAERLPEVLANMEAAHVRAAVCIGVKLEDFPRVLNLAESHPNLYATVGVHPDGKDSEEPSCERLTALAAHPKVVGIGETGLDYYWHKEDVPGALDWQRNRFRTHIRAARAAGKPLIIHTRESADDTMRILEEEGAQAVGGVMHCFTEGVAVAERALALGFYISLSGIVTFKKATQVHEVARYVPLDRLLVETDSPYLAPTPYRGKTNEPAYVRHVAEEIARLRGVSFDDVALATTANACRLFNISLS